MSRSNPIDLESEKLPFQWGDEEESEWGELVWAERCCPGVYMVGAKPLDYSPRRSLYAVYEPETGGIFSDEALRYGTRTKDAVIFDQDADKSPAAILEFEMMRQGIELDKDSDIFEHAHYAAENYPGYFGMLIPPKDTPAGRTVRYKTVCNGLYFVESETGRWFLAAGYCIWTCDLSEFARSLGINLTDQADDDLGYLFFDESSCVLPVYELLDWSDYQNLRNYISSQAALENELLCRYPQYALLHNHLEATHHGKGDILVNLMESLGHKLEEREETEEEIRRRIENCIRYTPQAEGEQWLLLPLICRG